MTNFAKYWQQFDVLNYEEQNTYSPASPPEHLNFTFDTIGQIIPISLGNVRLGLKIIWVFGTDGTAPNVDTGYNKLALSEDAANGATTLVFGSGNIPSWLVAGTLLIEVGTYTVGTVGSDNITISPALDHSIPAGTILTFVKPYVNTGESGLPPSSGTPAPTITFAAALSHPLDPEELGDVVAFFDGATQTFSLDDGGLVLPPDWSITNQEQLANSLSGAIIYPGTEGQQTAPLIVADKGASITNAFRGLRYIILQDYPIVGSGGTALPRLSVVFRRTNLLPRPTGPGATNATAVTFAAGSA